MNRSEPGRLKRLMSIMRCTRLVLPSNRTYLHSTRTPTERQQLRLPMPVPARGEDRNCPTPADPDSVMSHSW
jgi:hypothetical protein